MIIMTLEGIGISFGDTVLLQNVTQGIEDYDRIGVIGINLQTRSGDVTSRYATDGKGPTLTGKITSMSGDITIR